MDKFKRLTFSQILTFVFILSGILSLTMTKGINFHVMLIILICGSSLILLTAILLFLIPKGGTHIIYLFLIFILSFLYASYRNTKFPYPYGEFARVKVKLLSDPRVQRKAIQFTARVKGVYLKRSSEKPEREESGREKPVSDIPGHEIPGRFPRQKVLLNLPFGTTPLQRGDTIQVSGIFVDLPYERAQSYAHYLESKSIGAIFEGSSEGIYIIKKPARYSFIHLSNKLKRYINRVNKGLLLWPQGEFAVALFTGNRANLPADVIKSFRRSGTMHLLAVSGLHIGYLVMFFLLFFKVFQIKHTVIYLLLIGIIIFYMIFIGDSPSVKRASIMFLMGIFTFLFDRDRNYLNILSITFNILWISNPLLIVNPGFLLSFSATFAILFLVPRTLGYLKKIMPSFLAIPITVSICIQVYLLPVLFSFFGSFPYITVAANLPVVPLAGISLALEILYLALYPLFLPLAVIIAEVNIVVITMILRLTRFFSRVPPLMFDGFPLYLIPVYFLVITAGFWLLFQRLDMADAGTKAISSKTD